MFKRIRDHIQGAVLGSAITFAVIAALAAPHIDYNFHASNQSAAVTVAQDQSLAMAQLMPAPMPVPARKPSVVK